MSTPLTHQRFPTAHLFQEQIAYVTDNDRDAEALSCETEYPVVVKRPKNAFAEPSSERQDVPTLQTSDASEHSNVRNTSDASDIQNVFDVSGDANVSDVSSVENLPDVPDVCDIPDIQTSDL